MRKAYAIIGLQVDWDQLEKLKSCEHEKPEGAKFCPECGNPVGCYDMNSRTLLAYEVLRDEGTETAFICLHSRTSVLKDGMSMDLLYVDWNEIPDEKKKMREDLSPLKLWNDETFGLWMFVGSDEA